MPLEAQRRRHGAITLDELVSVNSSSSARASNPRRPSSMISRAAHTSSAGVAAKRSTAASTSCRSPSAPRANSNSATMPVPAIPQVRRALTKTFNTVLHRRTVVISAPGAFLRRVDVDQLYRSTGATQSTARPRASRSGGSRGYWALSDAQPPTRPRRCHKRHQFMPGPPTIPRLYETPRTRFNAELTEQRRITSVRPPLDRIRNNEKN